MKSLAITAVLLVATALPAQALNTDDLLSLVAMPLAVAAVADVAGVPQDQLADVVATLNQANVPPAQFVQVVRYVPVALVAQPVPQEPTFAQWLDTQTSQGVTGPALVTTIDRRLTTTYHVQPVIETRRVVVVDDNYVPDVVIARVRQVAYVDPLALALMPLAVAAASNLTGVPQDQLGDLVATLNQADVAPDEFIEIVRYAPVALVAQTPQQPAFVDFVRSQTQRGITGPALVTIIDRQLPSYGVIVAPRPRTLVVEDDRDFPTAVRERVAVAGGNPHGGPPGQIKKELGLQTGAEVVHGTKPGRQFEPRPAVVTRGHGGGKGRGHGNKHAERLAPLPPPMSSAAPAMPTPPQVPNVRPAPGREGGVPPGQAKKQGGEQGGWQGKGQGKGHGKGDR